MVESARRLVGRERLDRDSSKIREALAYPCWRPHCRAVGWVAEDALRERAGSRPCDSQEELNQFVERQGWI